MGATTRLLAALMSVTLAAGAASAQDTVGPRDLAGASLEDLLNITLTSAARKEQRAFDIPAAVYVITQEDIRSSGMTSLPDLLRLAPGVDVAQINGNKWAVSVRGFNDLYANKLLVLIDGRSVYNRIFAGVFWDSEDPMLDDIDRIEVIRGSGAAVWGANAVNGVINIVTKSAAATQGAHVRVEGGRSGEQAALRYGGTVGTASYRVYSQWTGREQSLLASGADANDGSHSLTAGFRTDWTAKAGAFTVEGAFTTGRVRSLWTNFDPQTAAAEPVSHDASDLRAGHVLGRWTHTRPSGASLQVQSFADVVRRVEPLGNYDRQTFSVDTQYHLLLAARHDVVGGAAVRLIDEQFVGNVGIALAPAAETSSLSTGFLQDEIALFGNRLALTLGTQVQYDSFSHGGVQPNARVMWKAIPHQRLWASASRALRTPALIERRLRLDSPPAPGPGGLPLLAVVVGNPAAKTESLVSAEAGYRVDIGGRGSVDLSMFSGHYDNLRTEELGPAEVLFAPYPHLEVTSQLGNQLEATTRGLEVSTRWTPVPAWELEGSYTALRITPHLAATSRDPSRAAEDGSAPRSQWQLQSTVSPGHRATLRVSVFRVGRLQQYAVDAYTRADVTAEWRVSGNVSVMAIGQNLLDGAHLEFGGATSLLSITQVPRSAGVRLVWRTK